MDQLQNIYLDNIIADANLNTDFHPTDGWMTCNFMSFSTVFQSYQDNAGVGENERLCAMEPRLQLKRWGSNSGQLDQKASPSVTTDPDLDAQLTTIELFHRQAKNMF